MKNIEKRIFALLIASTLTIQSMPLNAITVYAQELDDPAPISSEHENSAPPASGGNDTSAPVSSGGGSGTGGAASEPPKSDTPPSNTTNTDTHSDSTPNGATSTGSGNSGSTVENSATDMQGSGQSNPDNPSTGNTEDTSGSTGTQLPSDSDDSNSVAPDEQSGEEDAEELGIEALDEGGDDDDGEYIIDSDLLINGKSTRGTGLTISYGQHMTFSLKDHDSSNTDYMYRSAGSSGDWHSIANGVCSLEPGSYALCYSYGGPNGDAGLNSPENVFSFTVTKAAIAVPQGLRWNGSDLVWTAPTATSAGGALPSDAVSGYDLRVYKDGDFRQSYSVGTAGYQNFDNHIVGENGFGQGSYTFTVQAKLKAGLENHYTDSDVSASSPALSVPRVTAENGNGVTGVTGEPQLPQTMIPGITQVTLTADVQDGYSFVGWSGEGITFSAPNSLHTTAKVTPGYSGSTSVTITATAKDVGAPSISSYTAESSMLKATAADSGDGIVAYAFSTAADESGVQWQTLDTPVQTRDFSLAPTDPGSYYFYVKDAAGNIKKSDRAISVTAVQYIDYYNGTKQDRTDYIVGGCAVTVPTPVRSAWEFQGWYLESAFATPVEGSLSQHKPEGYALYAKWEKATLPELNVVSSDTVDETSDKVVDRTYNAQQSTLTVQHSGTANGTLSYAWEKDGAPVDIHADKLTVKNAADTGVYSVTVSLMDADGIAVDTRTISGLAVTIEKAPLILKPENKTAFYQLNIPDFGVEAVEPTKLFEGDTVTVEGSSLSGAVRGTIGTDYRVGNNVGEYEITLVGISSDNYKVETRPGTLSVSPISGTPVVTLQENSFTYNGQAHEPAVTVSLNDVVLDESNYDVAYFNNTTAGNATVTVTMKGNFGGSASETFTIEKANYAPTLAIDKHEWIYGDDFGVLSVEGAMESAQPTYYYAVKDSGVFSTDKPKDVGDYVVYAMLGETDNYNAAKTEPIEFTIGKRTITLTANSPVFTYDGMPHSDNGYKLEGTFPTGEGLFSVTVNGVVQDVTEDDIEPNNIIEIVLNSNTKEENYHFVLNHGTMRVVPQQLPAPLNPAWNAGTAIWMPVSKKDLTVSYTLKLFAYDGTSYDQIPVNDELTVSTQDKSMDFSGTIKAHAAKAADAGKTYTYYFTVQAIPDLGPAVKNYSESVESRDSASLYTALVTVERGDKISTAAVNGQSSAILLNGETAVVAATAAPGSQFCYDRSDTDQDFAYSADAGLSIADVSAGETSYSGKVTVSLQESTLEKKIKFFANNADPVITQVSASYPNGNVAPKAVTLSLEATDTAGINAWAIKLGPAVPTESDWHSVEPAQSITAQWEVTEPGTYYFFVRDTDDVVECAEETIDVSKVEFDHGTNADGQMASILKVRNQPVVLPAAVGENGFTPVDGYIFQNWRGTSGIYADNSKYDANPASYSETLVAYWTKDQYSYTVNYYLMNPDGSYNDGEDDAPYKRETLKAAHDTEISGSTASLVLEITGFELDKSEGKNRPITVSKDGTNILNIYYARKSYTLTVDYTMPDGTHVSKQQDFLYGAPISSYLNGEKPEFSGYTFVGWTFGDSGAEPATMPAKAVTATGTFLSDVVTYSVRYYLQDLDSDGNAANTYTHMPDRARELLSENGAAITLGAEAFETIEGCSYAFANWQSSEPGETMDAPAADTEIIAAADGYLCVYYTRQSYNLTFNVWVGAVGEGSAHYSRSVPVLFGAALPSIDDTFPQSQWGTVGEEYQLSAIVGWSTGTQPETMPAGDVTITRQYILKTTGSYQVKLLLEKEDSTYEEKVFYFYDNVGVAVSVGAAGSGATLIVDDFAPAIDYFRYYEVNKDFKEKAEGQYGAGIYASGVVTDTENAENPEPAVTLVVKLDRSLITSRITYKADGTTIATVTKEAKWGTNYDYEPLAFFDTVSGGNWKESNHSAPQYSGTVDGKHADEYDFRQNGYVVSYTGKWNLNKDTHWASKEFTTVESLGESTSHPMGYENNEVTVNYVKPEPLRMYELRVVYNTKGIVDGKDENVQLKYTLDGKTYDVWVANDAFFYNDVNVALDSVERYPGLANLVGRGNDAQRAHFVYSDANLKSGYTKDTIAGRTCYIDESKGRLYIADTDNQLYINHQAFFGFETESDPGSEMVQNFLKRYNESHEQDAVVYNRSFGSTVKEDTTPGILQITFRNVAKCILRYNLGGSVCQEHTYSKGDTVTDIGCDHTGVIIPREGYTIVWYTDSAFQTKAQSIKMDSDKWLYGRYERNIVINHAYAYYQLADTGEYITAATDDLTASTREETVTLTDDTGASIEKTINITTYSKDGQVVMVCREVPSLTCSDVSIAPESFGECPYGMCYDTANRGNLLQSYCQAAPVTLRAYFVRNIHTLTLDSKIEGSNPQVAQYRVGQTIETPHGDKGGYAFAGWNWFRMPGNTAIEEVVTMPDFDVLAEAKSWTPVQLDPEHGGGIFHYFQNPDLTYSKAAVDALRNAAKAEAAAPQTVKVLWQDRAVDAALYPGQNGGIIFRVDGSTYYVVSLPEQDENGAYDVHPEKLAAIFQPINTKPEDALSVDTNKQTVEFYSFGSAVQETKTEINAPENGQFISEYGQVLEYYYELESFSVTARGEKLPPANGKGSSGNGTLTILGAGTYRYGETAHMTVTVPAGYTFVGWYDASGTQLDTEQTYEFRVETAASLVAKMQAKPVSEPALNVTGIDELVYGYAPTAVLTAKAEFGADADPACYVKGYRWVLDSSETDSTSASFTVPSGLAVGEHTVQCYVIVARKDSGVEISVGPQESKFSVAKDQLQLHVTTEDVTCEYDKKPHCISLSVDEALDPGLYTVYYSQTELNADNCSAAGQNNPEFINVNRVNGSNQAYTVYYYVKSHSPNYEDASGSAQVMITPKRLSLLAGTASYSKTYDGDAKVLGSITQEGSDLYKLVRDTNIYSIRGLLPNDTMDTYIISCNAEFNSAHVSDATSITMSDIQLASKDTGAIVYNYDFDNTVNVYLTGYIEQREIKLQWDQNSFPYDGDPHCPNVEGLENVPEKDARNLTVNVSGVQTNVGSSYTAVASLVSADEDNTVLSDFRLENGGRYQYSIVGRTVVIAMADDTVTYDGEEHTLSQAKLVDGTLVTGHTVTASGAETKTDAGQYRISPNNVVIRDADGMVITRNYTVKLSDAGVLTIARKPVTVSGITAKSKTYDGKPDAQLNLNAVTLTGVVEGDELKLDANKVAGAFDTADAGKQKTVSISYAEGALSGNSAGNYVLSADCQKTALADINARTITVKIAGESIVYGENEPEFKPVYSGYVGTLPTINGSISCTVGKSEADAKQYAGGSGFGVGSYFVYPDVSGLSADNYIFAADNTGVLEITQRPVVIRAAEGALVEKTYDGTTEVKKTLNEELYTFLPVSENFASGVLTGDTVALSSGFTALYQSKEAGSTNVNVIDLTLTNGNYKLVNESFTIPGQINKKLLSVTAVGKSTTYGKAAPEFTADYDGFVTVNGVTEDSSVLNHVPAFSCDYDTENPENRRAGTYPIMVEETLSADNYEIQYVPGELKVSKAAVTIQAMIRNGDSLAKTASVTYGSEGIPVFDYTASGFQYDDADKNLITAAVSYEHGMTTAQIENGADVIASPAGEYSVKPKFETEPVLDNYEFEYSNAIVTIQKYQLTVTGIQGGEKIYDGTNRVLESQLIFTSADYQGLLSFDRAHLTEAALRDPLNQPEPILVISDAHYGQKDVGENLSISFTVTFGPYLDARYSVNGNQNGDTADIKARPLLVRPGDEEVSYGDNAPDYKVFFLPLQDDGETLPDTGLVKGETPTEIVGVNCAYTIQKDQVSGVTTYPISPVKLLEPVESTSVLRNYKLHYEDGVLTVKGQKLDAPAPQWIADNPSKVQWSEVSGIGDVKVDHYKLQLQKDGSPIGDPVTVSAGAAYVYDYLGTVRSYGAGAYSVAIQAIASAEKNTDPKNVDDSDWGKTSADLYAAEVSFVFGQDKVTQEGKGSTISIMDKASYVVVAGEKNIPIHAELKNATGYTVASVTSSSTDLSIDKPSDEGRTRDRYASAVALSAKCQSASPIAVTLALAACEAKATLTIHPAQDSSATTIYGYGTEKAPHFVAEVTHPEDYTEYTYTYTWKLKENKKTSDVQSTVKDWTLPSGYNANNNPKWYTVSCVVVATRKDNGESTTQTAEAFLKIDPAAFITKVKIDGWKYGEHRKEAYLFDSSVSAQEHPTLNNPEYTYASADADLNDPNSWSSQIPTDAGDYYIRAYIPASQNYNDFTTPASAFTIEKAKLADPEPVLSHTDSSYAKVSYPVSGIRENGTADSSASQVRVQYAAALYKGGTLVHDFLTTDASEQDIAKYLTESGMYTLKVRAIAVSSNGAPNCDDSEEISLDIPVTATITAETQTKMYDGEYVTMTASVPGGSSGAFQWYYQGKQIPGATGSTLRVKNVVDSGSYTCVMTAGGNTVIAPALGVTITPRKVTLTSATLQKDYDSTELTNVDPETKKDSLVTVGGNGFAKDEGVQSYTFNASQLKAGSTKNTFDYTLKGNTLSGNYSIEKIPGTLTVNKRTAAIVITAATNTKKYDGDALRDNHFTFTGDTMQGNDELTAVVEGEITHVKYDGSGNVTGVANEVTSFKVMRGNLDVTDCYTFGESQPGTLTVTPRSVTLTSANLSKIYDGTALTNVDPETVSVSGDGFVKEEGVGSYTFSGSQLVKGTSDNEFTYELNGKTNEGDYVITKKAGTLTVTAITAPIVVTAASESKAYDGTALKNANFSFTENVLLAGDKLSAVVKGEITHVKYDEQKQVIGVANEVTSIKVMRGNQDVTGCYTFGQSVSGTLTVTPRRITMTSANAEKFYDGTELTNFDAEEGKERDITVVNDDDREKPGFAAGEGAAYTFSASQLTVGSTDNSFTYQLNQGTTPGDYSITVRFGTLEVKKRVTITVTAASESRPYDGTALTNDHFTYSCEGGTLGEGDRLYAEVEGTITNVLYDESGKVIGVPNVVKSYKVLHNNKDDVTSSYTFNDSIDGELKITPVAVTLYAVDASKTYGEEDKPLDVRAEGMIPGETKSLLKWVIARDAGENASTYPIRLTADSVQGNYTVAVQNGTFTILPLQVTLTWTPTAITYNGAVHSVTAVISNAVSWNGTKDDVTVSTYSGDKDKTNVGSYTTSVATLSGASAGNYTLEGAQLAYNWKIEPRSLAKSDGNTTDYAQGITVSQPDNVTYNGGAFTPEVTVYDDLTTVGGPGKVKLKENTDYTLTYEQNRNAGTAVITITGIGNYTGKITRTFRINPRPVTLKWQPDEVIYNAQQQRVTATVSNAVNQDVVKVECTGDSAVNAGKYRAEAHALVGPAAQNYTLSGGTNLEHLWIIHPAPITLRPDDQTVTVGEKPKELTWSVISGTLYPGDEPGDVNLYAEVADAPGEYPIQITVSDANPNYEITVEDGTITVVNGAISVVKPQPVPGDPEAPIGTRGSEDALCLWHWLIILADALYLVLALLTMKRKKTDDEQSRTHEKKRSVRRRWASGAVLAVLLIVLNILGSCIWEPLLTVLTAIVMPIVLWATFRYKFSENTHAEV